MLFCEFRSLCVEVGTKGLNTHEPLAVDELRLALPFSAEAGDVLARHAALAGGRERRRVGNAVEENVLVWQLWCVG